MKEFILKESEMLTFIQQIKVEINKFQIPLVLLSGEMGSGKTTFVRNLVHLFDKTKFPNSPTYNLVNEYKLEKFSIYHFDLHRIKTEIDIEELGFEDIWKNEFCIIEWWKIAESFLPKERIEIEFFHHTESSRRILLKLVTN